MIVILWILVFYKETLPRANSTRYRHLWRGRWDLNPRAFRHMILSHSRLPVPTPLCVKSARMLIKSPEHLPGFLTEFISSRRQGLSYHTIAFYKTSLKPFVEGRWNQSQSFLILIYGIAFSASLAASAILSLATTRRW